MPATTTHDRYPTRVSDEPRILDRVDPVVAGSAREPGAGPLTRQQVDSFERDGFLFLEDVFSGDEAKRYLAELHRLSADEELKRQERVITERGTDEVRSIFEIHRVSELFAAMASDPGWPT
jgi:ectoine hydroxylase